jgi:hypothetical protein
MAILQDFEDYASGTDLSPLDPKQADPFSGDTNVAALDPSQILLGMEYARARQDAATAYEQNFPKYQSRLKEFVYQAPERDIFDLASDLGAGILASQQKGGRNPYVGIGIGFNTFNERLRADEEMNQKSMQQMGLQAASLAMQSEQQAKEYLNQMGVKLIDLANKETPWINIEYDGVDADGNTVRMNQSLPNTPAYKSRIEDLMLNKGGKEVKLADTQINMPDPNARYGDKKAIDSVDELRTQYRAEANASNAIIDQVGEAYLLAQQIDDVGGDFGPMSSATLRIRETLVGLGFGDLLDSPDSVGKQKALNQLAMGFTMAIISGTKGAISNKEMELFIQASPTLGSTIEGFMEQLRLLEKMAYRKKDFNQAFLTKLQELNDDSSLTPTQRQDRLELYINGWAERNPLLTEEETAFLQDKIDNPNIASDFVPRSFRQQIEKRKAALSRLPLITTQEEFDALPAGAYYRTPTGQRGQKKE